MYEFEVIDNWWKELEEQSTSLHKKHLELEKRIKNLEEEKRRFKNELDILNSYIKYCGLLEESINSDELVGNEYIYHNNKNGNRKEAIKFLKNKFQSIVQIKQNELKTVEEELEYLQKEQEVVKSKMKSNFTIHHYLYTIRSAFNKIMTSK